MQIKGLTFAAAINTATAVNPTEAARSAFLSRLNEQLEMVQAEQKGKKWQRTVKKDGKEAKQDVKPWYLKHEDVFYVQPRYGNAKLILQEGKPLIQAGKTLPSVDKTLAALKTAAEAGTLDEVLLAAKAKRSRK